MKYTLLDIVQTVLSAIEGDEVNSVTDTAESLQIAYIVRRIYNQLQSTADLPEHNALFQLTATSASTPTIMTKPSDVLTIDFIKYNKQTLVDTNPRFTSIRSLGLSEFLNLMHSLEYSDSTVESFDLTTDGRTFTVLCRNDVHPNYYTTFNDNTILFDSYDSTVDSNLQSSKTLGYGLTRENFSFSDTFTPSLDDQQFHLLVNECISLAFVELKQQANPKVEAISRRAWINLQRTKEGVKTETFFEQAPNYGRKR